VPSALFLAVMARPIIALLFQHGRFHAVDTVATGDALLMYCVGLPAFAAVGIFTRAFYAQGDTRTPVQATFVAVGVNLGLNLLFVGPLARLGLAHRGLALATSVTAMLNLVQLAVRLRSRLGGVDGGRILRSLGKLLVASGLTAAGLVAGLMALGDVSGRGVAFRAAVVAGGALGALVVGGLLMWLLRVEELALLRELVRSFAGRFRRGPGAA